MVALAQCKDNSLIQAKENAAFIKKRTKIL